MPTRTDLVASLTIPATGIDWDDMRRALGDITLQSFMAAVPSPFLLELPVKASDLPIGLQPRLVALNDVDLTGRRVHNLRHGDRPLVAGRSKSVADVVLADKTVSKRHASLEPSSRGWRVTDLEAANGTWVEGARARVGVQTPVAWGEVIRFSTSYHAILLPPQSLFALATGMDPHGHSIKAGLGEIPPTGLPLRELVARVDRLDRANFGGHCEAAFLLEIPNETELDEEVLTDDLPDGATRAISHSRILRLKRGKRVGMAGVHPIWPTEGGATLGRSDEQAELVISDGTSSKQHAKFTYKEGRWHLADLGSKNGTYVEGDRLEPGLARRLRFGQTLSFSSYRALFLGPKQILELVQRTTRRM